MKRIMALLASVAVLLACGTNAAAQEPELPRPIRKDLAKRSSDDPRVRKFIYPSRVVWTSRDSKAVVENAEALLKKGSGQVTLSNRTGCTLRHNGATPGVLLDFGRELQGGVQILVPQSHKNKPVRLRVRFGESVSEAMSDVGGKKNATNDHAVRDQTCLVPWLGAHEIGNTGFRFVRIDLVEENKSVQLKEVRAVFVYRPLKYLGSFRCSDERLNRIWETGAYTVHLNMQDYLWDGIKRDRLVWVGDMHPETMTLLSVFDDRDVVPASLDLIRDETPLPKWMNGISSYSMWWVRVHHSWYRHHGNRDYLEAQKDYLKRLLKELVKHVGPDHRETLPQMRFLDWPTRANKKAVHAGLHALLILTLREGAQLCGVLGEEEVAKQCLDTVERLKRHVPDHDGSKQAAALMALAGLGDAAALNREVLAVDGAKRMSTFYGYYVLQARALAGDYQGAIDCIRQYWGAMLDLGATTFWEDFDLDWTKNAARIDELVPEGKKDIHGDFGNYCYKGFRHSLCHGWASGPTAWMSEHILGIRIVRPGCRTIRLDPHLGDLEWAEGTFPTPMGLLKVRHEKGPGGKVESRVAAPEGVLIVKKELRAVPSKSR